MTSNFIKGIHMRSIVNGGINTVVQDVEEIVIFICANYNTYLQF